LSPNFYSRDIQYCGLYRPIVPAPVDYDDGEIGGMMIGKGN
jgi:hypothetical protein